MAATPTIPVISSESNLSRYLQEIRRFPMLAPEEEYMLGKSWREHGDIDAAHKLVTSHLRLVAKIAMGYRGYGLPLSELISEGNVGMMQAVKRFEPDRGFRVLMLPPALGEHVFVVGREKRKFADLGQVTRQAGIIGKNGKTAAAHNVPLESGR